MDGSIRVAAIHGNAVGPAAAAAILDVVDAVIADLKESAVAADPDARRESG